MAKIRPPRLPLDDPERTIDCELYLEPAFDELADAAVKAGWTEDEVEAALVGLAKSRILARIERRSFDRRLAQIRQQRQLRQ